MVEADMDVRVGVKEFVGYEFDAKRERKAKRSRAIRASSSRARASPTNIFLSEEVTRFSTTTWESEGFPTLDSHRKAQGGAEILSDIQSSPSRLSQNPRSFSPSASNIPRGILGGIALFCGLIAR
jgi:hypothetical protein